MHISNLKIKSWNIYGIFKNINGFQYNKLHDPDFIEHTKQFLIFGLIQTSPHLPMIGKYIDGSLFQG